MRLAAIHTQAEYDSAVAFMNQLLDVVGDDEEHELADMLELLGQLVEDYDQAHHVLPDADPSQVLRFLMEQHGLRQSDLTELGSQGVVSEILTAKRELNLRQVRALAERFSVSVATFV